MSRNLSAFSVTVTEDVNIATATINGVINPTTANGTAIALYPSARAKFALSIDLTSELFLARSQQNLDPRLEI